MNENTPASVQWDDNPNGTVSFATDVVATIAGLAATEVEGVASMTAGSGSLADIFNRRMQASRNFTKGVKVDIENNRVLVDVSIIVEYGTPVPDVASSIQENVKKAIETMSGLDVQSVDVHVQGVSFERENRVAYELEQQQRKLLEEQESADARAHEDAQAREAAKPRDEEDFNRILDEFPDAPAPQDDDAEFDMKLDPDDDAECGAELGLDGEAEPDDKPVPDDEAAEGRPAPDGAEKEEVL